MTGIPYVTGIHSSIPESIIETDRWSVKPMQLSIEKLERLWEILQRHKTLFSDFTRGDKNVWIGLVTRTDTYWLEVYDIKTDDLVGIIYFENIMSVDIEAHMVYFDRKPAEKIEVGKAIIRHMFANFPIQRITVVIPVIYNATGRMLDKLGFKREGKKRASVLLGGHWVDQYMYGILRGEA